MELKSFLMRERLFIDMSKKLAGMLLLVTILVGCSGVHYNNTAPGQIEFSSKSVTF